MPRTVACPIEVVDAEPVARALDAARELARTCRIVRFNPCCCESCARFKDREIATALDAFERAGRSGEEET